MSKNSSKLLREFIERSCEELNVRQSDVFSPSREATVTHLRSSIMYLINKRLRVTKIDIGRMFDRDHSTVVHAVKKVKVMNKSDHMYFVYNAVEPIWREVFAGTLFEDEVAPIEVAQQPTTELNGVLTASEVADLLRVTTVTVSNMVKRGEIKCFMVGRVRRFPASEIQKIMSV